MRRRMKFGRVLVLLWGAFVLVDSGWGFAATSGQVILLDGSVPGKVFEGVGAVSGGGATSVLLKDYPERERGEILDVLFKPNFAASMQTLYVEVGGDGNSTQGSEPSPMHSRDDENTSPGTDWG